MEHKTLICGHDVFSADAGAVFRDISLNGKFPKYTVRTL